MTMHALAAKQREWQECTASEQRRRESGGQCRGGRLIKGPSELARLRPTRRTSRTAVGK